MIRYGAQFVAILLVVLVAAPPAFAQSVDADRSGTTRYGESGSPRAPAGAPPTGQIDVRTDPSGAKVFLDGKEQDDTTHTTLKGVPARPHLLTLTRNYLETGVQVKVTADRTTSVYVDLYPFDTRPGHPVAHGTTLEVDSSPSNALVEVDGKTLGKTPLFAVLERGKHDVHVGLSGYHEAQLATGETTQSAILKADLAPESEAYRSSKQNRLISTIVAIPFFVVAGLNLVGAIFAHAGPENEQQRKDNDVREANYGAAVFGYGLAGAGILYLGFRNKPPEDPASTIQVSAVTDSTGRPLAPAVAWQWGW